MTFHTFYHLTRADFLQRIRNNGLIIMLALTAYLSYVFVPPLEANYTAVSFGNYRLLYNSAGIGLMFGFTVSLFLSLFAFYVVKNGIKRDYQTGVGKIIATTPTQTILYLLGKWGSNLIFLTIILLTMTLMAPLMQWFRGEATAIHLYDLIVPIWLIGLPAMSLVAGLSVLFESIPWLRGGVGNIAYFILWSVALVSVASLPLAGEITTILDPYGVAKPLQTIYQQIIQIDPTYELSLSILGGSPITTILDYSGDQWGVADLLGRLSWLLGGGLFAASGVLFFDRFKLPVRAKRESWLTRYMQRWQRQIPQQTGIQSSTLTPLTHAPIKLRVGGRLLAELRLLLKGQPWFVFAGCLGLFMYQLATPLNQNSVGALYPMILPVLIWSAMGTQEHIYRTMPIIVSTPHHKLQQVIVWLAGVIISLMVVGGYGIQLVFAGEWLLLFGMLCGSLFVPSLALALGTRSGTRRLFEIVYLLWWYIAINVQGSPLAWLDFTAPDAGLFYLFGTVVLLAFSILKR